MVFNKKFDTPTVWELVRSIPNIRRDWSLKTPYKKFCYFYAFGREICTYLKVPAFNEDQTLCFFSYFALVYVVAYLSLTIYTIYYYLMNSEFEKSLPCTCLLGPVLASFPFLCIALSKYRYAAHNGLDYSGKYIYPDKHEDKKYVEICSTHLDNMMKNYLTRIGIMGICLCFVELSQIYKYIMDGTKMTLTQLRIPFTDEYSNVEFICNYLLQSIIAFHGFPGYIVMEILMEIYLGCITIGPKVMEHEFRKLEDNIEKQKYNKVQVYRTFNYIIKLSMENDDYIAGATDLVYWRAFVTPPAFTFGIGMSFFCEYMFGYVGGYALGVLSYVQLYYICILGEVYQNNGSGEVFQNTNWYLFPAEVKKSLMLVIHKKQNEVGLAIGPFAKINLECFYVISKKIYSFVMFLVNFYQ